MTAAQLATASGVTLKTACRVLAELREQKLVECLAPQATRCRPYTRTRVGHAVWGQISSCVPTELERMSHHDLVTYSEVCHRHRSAVVRGLGEPRRASEIKRWLRSNQPGTKISANNIRDVIQELINLGVAFRTNPSCDRFPVYALTERGHRYRRLLDQVAPAATPLDGDSSRFAWGEAM